MNKSIEADILQYLAEHELQSQRSLAEELGYSLGSINQGLKSLQQQKMTDESGKLTTKAKEWLKSHRTQRAVILAAGTGMRMVPINREVSKGLLEVKGQTLIERLIIQLQEKGIREIYIVVGFLKEQYEYLIDRYGVELIVNREYEQKNNLHSLALAAKHLENAYVIPCDLWSEENPFHFHEGYAWYMVGKELTYKSDVIVNRKGELVCVEALEEGNRMIGIAYLDAEVGKRVADKLAVMTMEPQYEQCFWEEALYEKQKMLIKAKVVEDSKVFEINTYEQLRQMDSNSSQLDSEVIRLLASLFSVEQQDIKDITVLKKGMTNRSFLFSCKGKRYIMRIPGEGTQQMINRSQEYDVYQIIEEEHVSDDIFYMNPENGYKVTEYLEGVHNCDAENMEEVEMCMQYLRKFHEKKLEVQHEFDLFEKIVFYESLWQDKASIYPDYLETKKNVLSLKRYIEQQKKDWCLTHMDAISDNFLVSDQGIRLIDWEYAAMQDPHVDVAMFAIYALYNRQQVDQLIDFYFQGDCPAATRRKIYCYIALAGLMWSNWCEYKRQLGIEFGEYSLRQYRYAKEYYRLFKSMEGEDEAHA